MTPCLLCRRTPTTRALYVAHDNGPLRALLTVDLCGACLAQLAAGEAGAVADVRRAAGISPTKRNDLWRT